MNGPSEDRQASQTLGTPSGTNSVSSTSEATRDCKSPILCQSQTEGYADMKLTTRIRKGRDTASEMIL